MKDDNCIFCKLASGEIPSVTIYEDADFRVILDLSPASKGHALIIPKEHYRNLYDLDDELAAKALVLAKKMVATFHLVDLNQLYTILFCLWFLLLGTIEFFVLRFIWHRRFSLAA